jgi:hypothetical protein
VWHHHGRSTPTSSLSFYYIAIKYISTQTLIPPAIVEHQS